MSTGSSSTPPPWGRGPQSGGPGGPGGPRRSGWRPQDWSARRGLAIGLSGLVVLMLLVGIFGGGGGSKDKKSVADGTPATVAAAATTSPAPAPTTTSASPSPSSFSPTPSPSPTETLPVLPDFSGTDLQRAQDQAQALGFYALDSHDLTGQGRHQVLDRNWRVCSQSPSRRTADPSTTTVTFNVVEYGESCALRVHAAPGPTRTPTPTHTTSGNSGTTGGTSGSTSGGTSSATCASHTVGVCAADSPHPTGATAQCDDGTYSYSASFRGTCSHHDGVHYWYR